MILSSEARHWDRLVRAGGPIFPVTDGQVGSRPAAGVKGGVAHAQRIEDSLLHEKVEWHATDDFNHTGGRVDAGLSVAPL